MGISRSLLAAQFFWNLDRTKQALQEVAGHLSDSPLDSEGLVLRSELLLKLGRLDEAEDSARQAITGNRQCMQAFLLLARIARTRNQWSEAEEFARQSLAVQANWLALNELALALLGQGNLSEALDCLDESLDLCWHEWTLYLRGCVLLELDLEQAERVFQSLLEWNPHGFGLLGLASVARERGRFAQALHYAELALANDPENDALHSLYAQADIELQVSIPPVGVRGSGLVLLALFLSLWISALVQAVGPVIGTPPLWITIWLEVAILMVALRDAWQTVGFLSLAQRFPGMSDRFAPRFLITALGWLTLVVSHRLMTWTALAQVVQVLIVHRLGMHYRFRAVILTLLPAVAICLWPHPPALAIIFGWWIHLRLLRKYLFRAAQDWKAILQRPTGLVVQGASSTPE
ncbi:tetratricopeptide repeat protein [bacterium]|nr:tetratricopeptide repeat protein [bacterium]